MIDARFPAFDTFQTRYLAGEAQIVWTRLIDDLETPVAAYLKLGHGKPYTFLYESVEGGAWRGRYSIIALDPDLVWRANGDSAEISEGADISRGQFTPESVDTLTSLRRLVEASRLPIPSPLPPMAAGLFGVLGYDMIRLAEPLGPANPDPLDLPDGVMIRPQIIAVFDSVVQEIILCTPVRPKSGVTSDTAYKSALGRLTAIETTLKGRLDARAEPEPSATAPLTSKVDRSAYGEMVEKAKSYIAAGDIFQVVPSHRFSAPYPADPFGFYRSLRRTNPSPFLFFLNFGEFQLAGSSPEILVRLRDRKVSIRPIAGTRRRGKTPEEDVALEAELLADPKERAEHLMLLDLGRNDVGRAVMPRPGQNAAATGPRVRVTETFVIERYSHVMHIVSNVEGDAPQPVDPIDVILTALPAGTLSGAPKVRAMQIIDELETEKRGLGYGGAAGYISADGSLDTCIVLRTALFKDGMMYVQAGGGVVADSDPDAEYEETLHKSDALRRAAEEAWRFS